MSRYIIIELGLFLGLVVWYFGLVGDIGEGKIYVDLKFKPLKPFQLAASNSVALHFSEFKSTVNFPLIAYH